MSDERTAALNTLWGRLVVEELVRCGVGFACVSPGSRSTPLTAAIARERRLASCVWLDERGAAFHALGHARATGRPAALVCTSGTAVANYLPAIVEASQDRVPLVVLSADRPPELVDAGANQAILQPGIFGERVRWSFSLPAPSDDAGLRALLTTIDQAVHRALGPPAGPVHLNFAFREPLGPTAPAAWPDELPARWREGSAPLTSYARSSPGIDERDLAPVGDAVAGARRGLLVLGHLPAAADREAALGLAAHLGWPVAADIRSGLRLGAGFTERVGHIDQLLLDESVRGGFAPDVVLHLGGPLVSKRVAQALAARPAATWVSVQDHPARLDPDHRVTHRVESSIAGFCGALRRGVSGGCGGAWGGPLRELSARAGAAIDAFVAATPFGEIAAARHLSRAIPEGHGLFLANSMPVRDVDMFAAGSGPRPAVAVNRGASGIDGTVSSAAGFASGLGRPATLLTGDLSLLHDLTALIHLRSQPQPLVIVALNNRGGGIFHFLPIASQPDLLEPWFTAPHDVDLAGLEPLFGVPVLRPRDAGEFADAYRGACAGGASAIIEVRTERGANLAAHRALGSAILAAIAGP
jgi:2-succinyl-5-enolpyruvyl-6-hydroxy-3-cyclohexene-1-carboxylate synthase